MAGKEKTEKLPLQRKADFNDVMMEPVVAPDVMTSEEALGKVVMVLADPKQVKHVSDLDDNEVKNVAALMAIAKEMDDEVLAGFCNEFLSLRISKNRMGRRELIELSKAVEERERRKWKNSIARLLGRGGNI